MIQIETAEAIDQLDAILTEVPDIDAVWLGTLDMRVSMGLGGSPFGGPEPEYTAAIAKFERILKKHDKPRGGLALGEPDDMKKLGKDNSLSFVAGDVLALAGMAATLPTAKAMFPAERKMADAEVNGNGNGAPKGLAKQEGKGEVAN